MDIVKGQQVSKCNRKPLGNDKCATCLGSSISDGKFTILCGFKLGNIQHCHHQITFYHHASQGQKYHYKRVERAQVRVNRFKHAWPNNYRFRLFRDWGLPKNILKKIWWIFVIQTKIVNQSQALSQVKAILWVMGSFARDVINILKGNLNRYINVILTKPSVHCLWPCNPHYS